MFDSVLGFINNNTGLLAGGGTAGIILWVLKKVPNKEICAWVESTCYSAGKFVTLGLSRWKFTKNFWNKTVEPWFIDLLDNFIGSAVRGLIKGLRVDK